MNFIDFVKSNYLYFCTGAEVYYKPTQEGILPYHVDVYILENFSSLVEFYTEGIGENAFKALDTHEKWTTCFYYGEATNNAYEAFSMKMYDLVSYGNLTDCETIYHYCDKAARKNYVLFIPRVENLLTYETIKNMCDALDPEIIARMRELPMKPVIFSQIPQELWSGYLQED